MEGRSQIPDSLSIDQYRIRTVRSEAHRGTVSGWKAYSWALCSPNYYGLGRGFFLPGFWRYSMKEAKLAEGNFAERIAGRAEGDRD